MVKISFLLSFRNVKVKRALYDSALSSLPVMTLFSHLNPTTPGIRFQEKILAWAASDAGDREQDGDNKD
jgi:hypothetical protein